MSNAIRPNASTPYSQEPFYKEAYNIIRAIRKHTSKWLTEYFRYTTDYNLITADVEVVLPQLIGQIEHKLLYYQNKNNKTYHVSRNQILDETDKTKQVNRYYLSIYEDNRPIIHGTIVCDTENGWDSWDLNENYWVV